MIKLYSTNCPRCMVLEKKLQNKKIEFEKITNFNEQELIEAGFDSAPVLEVDGEKKDYKAAIVWINER